MARDAAIIESLNNSMKISGLPISENMLKIIDVGFHLVHLSIIFFFLFGWLFETTQLAHFILSLFILLSWFGLGFIFGFGYCLVTDLQWRIKRRLNREPSAKLYIKYMLDKMMGWNSNPSVVNRVTIYVFFGIFSLSTILLFIRWFG